MGKGDQKTRRGKLFSGSFGVLRPRKKERVFSVITTTKKAVDKPEKAKATPKPKTEPVVEEVKPEVEEVEAVVEEVKPEVEEVKAVVEEVKPEVEEVKPAAEAKKPAAKKPAVKKPAVKKAPAKKEPPKEEA
jgi:ribosomal small subunit protein bTHX